MLPTYRVTLWPKLLDVKFHHQRNFTWSELAHHLTRVHVLIDKMQAPGFGPYALNPGGQRRDSDVVEVTLAVFDVDTGTVASVRGCKELLHKAGLAQVWYTTHSHASNKPSWRLVLPLARPVSPADWPALRRTLLAKYQIPADPKKCAGASHFYFEASCAPGALHESAVVDGAAVEPPALPHVKSVPTAFGITEPRRDESQDMVAVRSAVAAKCQRFARSPDPEIRAKSVFLQRCLDGQPLDTPDSHNRDVATLRVTGMVADACPTAPIEVLLDLVYPSVEAMRAQGWRDLSDDRLERMLHRALLRKAEDLEFLDVFRAKVKAATGR